MSLHPFVLSIPLLLSAAMVFLTLHPEAASPQKTLQIAVHAVATNEKLARKEFNKVKKNSLFTTQPVTFATQPEYLKKNRYIKFLPFDAHRSCREIEGFYISASDVETPLQKYIIAQAPLAETVEDFWKMIFYKDCSLIITTCMPLELGLDKCCPYWEKPYLPSRILGWMCSSVKEEILIDGPMNQRIVARHFYFEHSETLERKKCVQLHFESWPDLGVPDLDLFQEYLRLVDIYSNNTQAPIVVHCSAGIGRSGTFVATHSLRKELLSGKIHLDITQRVEDLRKQRAFMVTNSKQFQFIHAALLPHIPAD